MEKVERILLILGPFFVLGFFFLRGFLFESLWIDETLSYWVIESGYREVFQRAFAFQGQSPLYYLILRVWSEVFGVSELSLRSFSCLCLFLSGLLLFRIGSEFGLKSSARWLVVTFFLSFDVVQVAASARPYALALLFSLLTLSSFFKWQKKRDQWSVLLMFVFALFTWYAHYLFILCLFIPVFGFFFFEKQKRTIPWPGLLFFLIGTTPGIFQLWSLYQRKSELSFDASVSIGDFFATLFPLYILVYSVLSFLFVLVVFYPLKWKWPDVVKKKSISLLVLWYLLPVILFFLGSIFSSETSLFVHRYFFWNVPALCLFIGLCYEAIRNTKARVALLGVFLLFLASRESAKNWQLEDWRSVSEAMQKSSTGEIAAFIDTGLIESRTAEQRRSLLERSYLLSPFLYYRGSLPGHTYLYRGKEELREQQASVLNSGQYYQKIWLIGPLSRGKEKRFVFSELQEQLDESLLYEKTAEKDYGMLRFLKYSHQ